MGDRWLTTLISGNMSTPEKALNVSPMYITKVHEDYIRLVKTIKSENRDCGKDWGNTDLNAMIMCPLLDTGFVLSLYAVKLSSCHRISGCFPEAEDDEELGLVVGLWGWEAEETMPHIGQPGLGAKAMKNQLRGRKGVSKTVELDTEYVLA